VLAQWTAPDGVVQERSGERGLLWPRAHHSDGLDDASGQPAGASLRPADVASQAVFAAVAALAILAIILFIAGLASP